jgi:uncharacterized protein YyaL (SSP411 family)
MQNALDAETSPYLRQHAGNPVNWLPWSQQALDQCPAGKQTHPFIDRLFRLPLVPCHGA